MTNKERCLQKFTEEEFRMLRPGDLIELVQNQESMKRFRYVVLNIHPVLNWEMTHVVEFTIDMTHSQLRSRDINNQTRRVNRRVKCSDLNWNAPMRIA